MDLNLHWNKVNDGWRHIVSEIKNDKISFIVNNYEELFIRHIDTTIINTSLDWGCGGGLLTKELKKFSTACAIDISDKSLLECVKYANPTYSQALPNNLSDFNWNGPKIDFILCHALVWHFPNILYFKEVLENWKKIDPIYIAFNTKPTKEKNYIEEPDYKKGYLNALRISDKYTIKLLEDI